MTNIAEVEKISEAVSEIRQPSATESVIMQQVFVELKNGLSTREIALARFDLAGAATICRRYASMPNMAVQTTFVAGDALDFGLPSAAANLTTGQVSSDSQSADLTEPAVLAEPSRATGPTEIAVANIPLVNTVVTTLVDSGVKIETPSSSQVKPVASDVRASNGLAGPPLRRRYWNSMPNIAVQFSAAEVESALTAMSEKGQTKFDATSEACSLLQDPAILTVKPKRRSLWSRTKKIVRRMFCCA